MAGGIHLKNQHMGGGFSTKLSSINRSGYNRRGKQEPIGTILSCEIKRQVVDMIDTKGVHLFTAESIPGFYLAYLDPEVAYSLILPLATCLLWQSKGIMTELNAFDEACLRSEAGVAVMKLRVIPGILPKKTLKITEKHGAFFGDRRKTIFYPSESPGRFRAQIVIYLKELDEHKEQPQQDH